MLLGEMSTDNASTNARKQSEIKNNNNILNSHFKEMLSAR